MIRTTWLFLILGSSVYFMQAMEKPLKIVMQNTSLTSYALDRVIAEAADYDILKKVCKEAIDKADFPTKQFITYGLIKKYLALLWPLVSPRTWKVPLGDDRSENYTNDTKALVIPSEEVIIGAKIKRPTSLKIFSMAGLILKELERKEQFLETFTASPDGKYLATAYCAGYGADNKIDIWDLNTGIIIKQLAPEYGWADKLIITSDNAYLVAHISLGCRSSGAICVWILNDGQKVTSFYGRLGDITNNNKYAIDTVFPAIHDLKTGSELHRFKESGPRENIKVISDTILITSIDRKVYVWDIPSGALRYILEHKAKIEWGNTLASTDGKYLITTDDSYASSHNNNYIYIWDLASGKCVKLLSLSLSDKWKDSIRKPALQLKAISNDMGFVIVYLNGYTYCPQRELAAYSLVDGTLLHTLTESDTKNGLNSVTITYDQSAFIAGCSDNAVCLYDTPYVLLKLLSLDEVLALLVIEYEYKTKRNFSSWAQQILVASANILVKDLLGRYSF